MLNRLFLCVSFLLLFGNSLLSLDSYDKFISNNYPNIYLKIKENGQNLENKLFEDISDEYNINYIYLIKELTIIKDNFLDKMIRRLIIYYNQNTDQNNRILLYLLPTKKMIFNEKYYLSTEYRNFYDSPSFKNEINPYYKNLLVLILVNPLNFIQQATDRKIISITHDSIIPVPQGMGIIENINIPLASGYIADCVGIYAYTTAEYKDSIHGFIHYDRYCNLSKLNDFFDKIAPNKNNIDVILFTKYYSSQLINIIDKITGLNVKNICFHEKPLACFSQNGSCDFINVFDIKNIDTIDSIHVTCQHGKYEIKATEQTELSLTINQEKINYNMKSFK